MSYRTHKYFFLVYFDCVYTIYFPRIYLGYPGKTHKIGNYTRPTIVLFYKTRDCLQILIPLVLADLYHIKQQDVLLLLLEVVFLFDSFLSSMLNHKKGQPKLALLCLLSKYHLPSKEWVPPTAVIRSSVSNEFHCASYETGIKR